MDIKERIKKTNSILDSIDEISIKINNLSENLKDKAIDKAIDINLKEKPYAASSLIAKDIDDDLKYIIKDTNKSFKEYIDASEAYLAAGYALNLSKENLKDISKKLSLILDDLVNNTKILKSDIQKILTQNLSQGISQSRLIKDLKSLYPAYSRNASTLVNTGLSRLFIDTNVSKFTELDFKWYVWAGPNDSITRENPCKHWVWHRFSSSQLSTITSVRMRLWNCRHSIVPLLDSEINLYPKGNINF